MDMACIWEFFWGFLPWRKNLNFHLFSSQLSSLLRRAKQRASLHIDCRPGVRTECFTLRGSVPSSRLALSRALFLGSPTPPPPELLTLCAVWAYSRRAASPLQRWAEGALWKTNDKSEPHSEFWSPRPILLWKEERVWKGLCPVS